MNPGSLPQWVPNFTDHRAYLETCEGYCHSERGPLYIEGEAMQLCFADADCSLLSVKAKAKGTITHLQPAPPCLQNLRVEERREVNRIEHQKQSKIEEIERELKNRP